MPLDYYVIDETADRREYIEANSGTIAVLVRTDAYGGVWMTERDSAAYYVNGSISYDHIAVRRWDDRDRILWWNNNAGPRMTSVRDNVRGYAFVPTDVDLADPVYETMPTYVSKTKAFRRFGYVFIPDGIPDPRSGETLVEPPPVFGTDTWDDDEEPNDAATSTGTEGQKMNSVARWALTGVAGALAGYVAWMGVRNYL